MIVVDAPATLAGFFQDERTPAVVALFERVGRSGAIVPAIWRLEVANGFRMAIRRSRINIDFRDASLERLARLRIEIDPETSMHAWVRHWLSPIAIASHLTTQPISNWRSAAAFLWRRLTTRWRRQPPRKDWKSLSAELQAF